MMDVILPPQSRSRSRSLNPVEGTMYYLGKPQHATRLNYVETCQDVIGDYGGLHTLSLVREVRKGSFVNEPSPNPNTGWFDVPLPISGGSRVTGPSLSSYTNRMLAQTGPLTPSLYLPVALFELKDLPKMIRHAGDLLHKISRPSGLSPAKEAASATLAYQFGWAPIIQDIGKLLDLSNVIAKRQRLLKGAHSTKGIRRRVTLDQHSVFSQGEEILWSTFGHFITQRYTGTKSYKTWAVVRWKVRDPNQVGKEPTFQEAFREALGLSKGHIPVEVWKAMPWSWAIDWFAGISDILNAGRNSIYYRPMNLCVMRHSVNEWTYHPKMLTPTRSISGGHVITEWKDRYVHNSPSIIPTLRLPFMDNFKLSILGSFAILGMSRR